MATLVWWQTHYSQILPDAKNDVECQKSGANLFAIGVLTYHRHSLIRYQRKSSAFFTLSSHSYIHQRCSWLLLIKAENDKALRRIEFYYLFLFAVPPLFHFLVF